MSPAALARHPAAQHLAKDTKQGCEAPTPPPAGEATVHTSPPLLPLSPRVPPRDPAGEKHPALPVTLPLTQHSSPSELLGLFLCSLLRMKHFY